MPTINAYAALKAKDPLQPFPIQRREPGPHDVSYTHLTLPTIYSV